METLTATQRRALRGFSVHRCLIGCERLALALKLAGPKGRELQRRRNVSVEVADEVHEAFHAEEGRDDLRALRRRPRPRAREGLDAVLLDEAEAV